MEPARTIVEQFGGPNAVAEITGVHRTRVYSWMRAKEAGGTDGLIPNKHAITLIAEASKRGLTITGADFLPAPAEVAA